MTPAAKKAKLGFLNFIREINGPVAQNVFQSNQCFIGINRVTGGRFLVRVQADRTNSFFLLFIIPNTEP